jgi:hypothetical protein
MKNTSIASTLGFLCITLASTGLTMEGQNPRDMDPGLLQAAILPMPNLRNSAVPIAAIGSRQGAPGSVQSASGDSDTLASDTDGLPDAISGAPAGVTDLSELYGRLASDTRRGPEGSLPLDSGDRQVEDGPSAQDESRLTTSATDGGESARTSCRPRSSLTLTGRISNGILQLRAVAYGPIQRRDDMVAPSVQSVPWLLQAAGNPSTDEEAPTTPGVGGPAAAIWSTRLLRLATGNPSTDEEAPATPGAGGPMAAICPATCIWRVGGPVAGTGERQLVMRVVPHRCRMGLAAQHPCDGRRRWSR